MVVALFYFLYILNIVEKIIFSGLSGSMFLREEKFKLTEKSSDTELNLS